MQTSEDGNICTYYIFSVCASQFEALHVTPSRRDSKLLDHEENQAD